MVRKCYAKCKHERKKFDATMSHSMQKWARKNFLDLLHGLKNVWLKHSLDMLRKETIHVPSSSLTTVQMKLEFLTTIVYPRSTSKRSMLAISKKFVAQLDDGHYCLGNIRILLSLPHYCLPLNSKYGKIQLVYTIDH